MIGGIFCYFKVVFSVDYITLSLLHGTYILRILNVPYSVRQLEEYSQKSLRFIISLRISHPTSNNQRGGCNNIRDSLCISECLIPRRTFRISAAFSVHREARISRSLNSILVAPRKCPLATPLHSRLVIILASHQTFVIHQELAPPFSQSCFFFKCLNKLSLRENVNP